jgi:superfamily II DNA or RNA helicase
MPPTPPKSKLTTPEFIKKCQEYHGDKFDYSEAVYVNQTTKFKAVCHKHGSFEVTPTSHLKSEFGGCLSCLKKNSNESLWLDDLKVKARNVLLNQIFVDGFDQETNTVYLYGSIPQSKLDSLSQYNIALISEQEFLDTYKPKTKISILNNKYAQITIDPKLFNKLRTFLSYKTEGIEFTPAFRNGWNGITYLLDKNGNFLLGLLDKVKEFLNNNEIEFSIVDNRKEIVSYPPIDLSKRLEELGMVPRDYQERIVQAAINSRKGIIRACTGSGKSVCTALVAAHFNKPTIIYVIGLDLLQQFHDLYSKLFDEPIGFIGNGRCEIHRINIASIWTIAAALRDKSTKKATPVTLDDDELQKEIAPSEIQSQNIIKMLKETKLNIFDESHVCTTNTIAAILKKIDPENIYGFSGTPFRDDGADFLINGILGEQIVNVSASELIEKGFLAQPLIKFTRVPKTYIGSGGDTYPTVYKEYIVQNEIRNKIIFNEVKSLLSKNYQTLVLFKNLAHGKILKEMFEDSNIPFEYLSGKDSLKDRSEAKDNLINKRSNLILASTVLDIGVDIPTLSALVLAGGGKSSIRTLQRIGRVIRKFPGKKFAAIVDFFDDVRFLKKHSKKRHRIYSSETGFKLLIPNDLKRELS